MRKGEAWSVIMGGDYSVLLPDGVDKV